MTFWQFREANGDAQPDAVILDVLMPAVDGLEVCRRLRRAGNRVPVLMLTARDEIENRVAGLDAGADDYVSKPFALEELVARVRALLRRTSPDDDELLRFADLELDPGTREVRRGSDLIELTRTEFGLLELFMTNPRQVLTRSIIFERVWGYDFGFASNSLDVYIGYLRRKTEAGGRPRLIQTVRGVGYALREVWASLAFGSLPWGTHWFGLGEPPGSPRPPPPVRFADETLRVFPHAPPSLEVASGAVAMRPSPPPLRRKEGETSRSPPTPLPPLIGHRLAYELSRTAGTRRCGCGCTRSLDRVVGGLFRRPSPAPGDRGRLAQDDRRAAARVSGPRFRAFRHARR